MSLSFDLPPSQKAKPLPVNRGSRHKNAPSQSAGVNKKRKTRSAADDAPRGFKRLMAFAQGKKNRSGLDDGVKPPKKRKAVQSENTSSEASKPSPAPGVEMPTIRPGEKMADFAARVDAALPLSGLVTKTVKDGKDPVGLKVRRTKKEKKMHKLYDQWRDEDKKIKEKREEEMDEATERQIDEDLANGTWRDWTKDYSQDTADVGSNNKRKKKQGKGGKGGKAAKDDPWAEFEKKHAEPKRGLHDVVQAPPELQGPGNKLKPKALIDV